MQTKTHTQHCRAHKQRLTNQKYDSIFKCISTKHEKNFVYTKWAWLHRIFNIVIFANDARNVMTVNLLNI